VSGATAAPRAVRLILPTHVPPQTTTMTVTAMTMTKPTTAMTMTMHSSSRHRKRKIRTLTMMDATIGALVLCDCRHWPWRRTCRDVQTHRPVRSCRCSSSSCHPWTMTCAACPPSATTFWPASFYHPLQTACPSPHRHQGRQNRGARAQSCAGRRSGSSSLWPRAVAALPPLLPAARPGAARHQAGARRAPPRKTCRRQTVVARSRLRAT
jgi:hypothetical protein